MTAGADLLGAPGETPRKRGRPKGSKNKRAADLAGYVGAVYGGSAALQVAKFALVTPRELKAAGGSMARAQVAKAAELVELARGAQETLRAQLVDELERAAVRLGGIEKPRQFAALVSDVTERLLAAAEPLSLAAALKLLSDERAALLPYTDQKRPQAVEVTGKGLPPPAVIVVGGEPGASNTGEGLSFGDMAILEVSPSKSHDAPEPQALPGLEPPRPADE